MYTTEYYLNIKYKNMHANSLKMAMENLVITTA